jgi:polyferredoxin
VRSATTARFTRWFSSAAGFGLTTGILILARFKAPFPILLADRFYRGAGWIELFILGIYSAFLVGRFSELRDTSRVRLTIWLTFSIVFFTQFILGVSGFERLLMTGRLHVPVPAVVIAGPIYRGERFFMPILFFSTILLVGPAWCSYLCYFGAWDGLASNARPRSRRLGAGWAWLRLGLFVATPAVAILLRTFGFGGFDAGMVAVGFGVLGLIVTAALSRKIGTMVHCTSICPLGLAADLLGRLSPFRLRIGEGCNECGRCSGSCRYNALSRERIRRRRPGYTCTLCGDCIASCDKGVLVYSWFRVSTTTARLLFLVLVVSLHAVFIGVARI